MSDTCDFKEMARKALVWVLGQGIWILYRYEPESKDGPRHVLRMGVAVFDDEDMPLPYFLARSRRQQEGEDDSGFGRY